MSAPRSTADSQPAPGSDLHALPEVTLEEAAAWWVRLRSGATSDVEQREWRAWRNSRPEHELAWRRIEALNRKFQGIPQAVGLSTLERPESLGRRRAIKGLMLLLMAGAGYRAATTGAWFADYRTAVGERRKVVLADGSRLTLNTASAVDVVFDGFSRLVELRFGEMLIETATDPKRRPFRVETVHCRITALGTRFTVRDDAATSRAAVFEGRVEIEPAASSRPKRTLSAGEAARFTATRLLAIERVDESELSWLQGVLLADAMPLSKFIAELARYRRGHLACDPRVAHLRISGVFSLADTDRALASVADTLPVTVERFTDFWVTVRPR